MQQQSAFSVEENALLSPYCSMRAGGRARYLATPHDASGLSDCIAHFRERGIKYTVVGKCSNLLFPDGIYGGAVILTEEIKGISVSETEITASCGETMSSLARAACDAGIAGFEFCHGIPGAIGGGVYMNAGAYGGEIKDIFVSGKFLDKDLNTVELTASEMAFGYRTSVLEREDLILLEAKFSGERGDRDRIKAKMAELMARRREKQPLEYPSCGSAFKRPEGYFAGALIEQCGLKGYQIGGAQVSEKHAGFIVNKGSATASDVIALLEYVSNTVYEKTGVRLVPEIKIVK